MRYLPLTEEDRRASPSRAEWERQGAKLVWMRRMLGELPWPSEAEVEARLASATLPGTPDGLNMLAWRLVANDAEPMRFPVRELLGEVESMPEQRAFEFRDDRGVHDDPPAVIEAIGFERDARFGLDRVDVGE